MKDKNINQKIYKILLLFMVFSIITAAKWVEKRCWWWTGSQWIEQTGIDTAYCRKYLLVDQKSDSCNKRVWRIHFTDSLYFYPQTGTPGYWKTHPEAWPSGYRTSDRFFRSGKTWMEVLWTQPSQGDAYYILAHHYIAAVLNQASGHYVPLDVRSIIQSATEWFRTYTPPVNANSAAGKQAIAWAKRLDVYNNTGT